MSFHAKIFAVFFILTVACSSEQISATPVEKEKPVENVVSKTVKIDNYLRYLQAKNTKKMDEAAVFLKKAMEDDPENDLLKSEYFSILTLNGRLDEAYPFAVDEYKREPQSLLAVLVQVAFLVKQEKFEPALSVLSSFDNKAAETFLTPLIKTWLLVGNEKYGKALKALEKINVEGTEALYHFHVALISDLKKDVEETEKNYQKLMEKNQGLSLRAAQTYGNFLLRQENYERFNELLQAYRTGSKAFPLMDEAFFLAGSKKIEKNIPSYIPSAREGLAEAFFDIAGSLFERGTPESAFFFIQIALDLDPNLSLARVLKGTLLEQISRTQEAQKLYEAEKETSDIYFSSQISLAQLLRRQEKFDEAEDVLKKLSEKTANSYLVFVELGDVRMQAKKYAKAIEAYSKAIDLAGVHRKSMWVLFFSRGTAYERNNQWDLAEKDLLQAVLLNPDQPRTLNYLGYSWLERGKNMNEAKSMLERAALKDPANSSIADSLGWAYFLTEDYPKAVAVLEMAIQLDPASAIINDHLGDAYWRVDRKREARFQWERALTLKKELSPADIERIEAKLKDGLGEEKKRFKKIKTSLVSKKSLKKKK